MAAWDNTVAGNSFYIFHNNYYFSRFYTRITINFLIISVNTKFVHWFHQNIDFSLANIPDCTSLQPLIALSKKHMDASSISHKQNKSKNIPSRTGYIFLLYKEFFQFCNLISNLISPHS